MSEVLLVALSSPETASCLLAAALAVADMVGKARIEALVVRMPAEDMIFPSEGVLTAWRRSHWKAHEAARAAAIERVYRDWRPGAASRGHDCDWTDAEILPETEVASRGQRADLIVIDRPPPRFDETTRETLRAALFTSHRPVLVVPPDARPILGRRVAIAWRDDGRAIKAVIPALRYFAEAEISVLAGYRGEPKPDALPAPLAERGIAATLHPLAIGPAPFGKALLAKAAELEADLLVMGAYSHAPLAEMLLGGVTRYVLAHAEIPALMRH